MSASEPLARVLVAEDDRSVRDSLARVLRFEPRPSKPSPASFPTWWSWTS